MRLRKYYVWFAVLPMVIGLTACSGGPASSGVGTPSGKASASGLKIDYANFTDNSELFVRVRDGIQAAAKKVGATVKAYDNKGDGATALANARLIVNDHPDIVIEFSPDGSVGNALGNIFKQGGVPCIALNVPVAGCPIMNFNQKTQGESLAGAAAQYMKGKKWTGNNTTAIILQQASTSATVNASVRSFYSALAGLVPDMTPMAADKITATTTTIGQSGLQIDGKGTLDGSFAAVNGAIQSIPRDRNVVIMGINDDEALGALRAVEQAGRGDNTVVLGVGNSPSALKQLKTNPRWLAEAMVPFQAWGEIGMAMSVAVLNGATTPPVTYIPQDTVTKENMDKYYTTDYLEKDLLPPLPTESEYLVKTGVLQQFGNIPNVGK